MDREMSSDEVREKREAARRWANYVNADERVDARWLYLLVSETVVRTARGSWGSLKGLGGF
jgi:type III restriction enzyme